MVSISLKIHSLASSQSIVTMSKVFSAADVSSHNKPDDLFIIVDEDVYDVTKFADEHPGGKKSTLLFTLTLFSNQD